MRFLTVLLAVIILSGVQAFAIGGAEGNGSGGQEGTGSGSKEKHGGGAEGTIRENNSSANGAEGTM